MRHNILVVAQDVALRATMARWLIAAGYFVELADNDRQARELLASRRMALTIVAPAAGAPLFDPGETGGKLIIATDPPQDLSARGRSAAAADGYLSLPLGKQELLARVASVLQPQAEAPPAVEILSFDGFTIDLAGRALRDGAGTEVPLTRAEFSLLVVLARHPGRVLSRDQLLDAALGRRADPYDRSIDVLVGRLRRKIEPDPKLPRFIVTVVGEGYKFAAQLRENRSPERTTSAAPAAQEPKAQPQSIERRQLTVMSCGLAGSTALATRLDPEDLRVVFADYHRCCAEVIASLDGKVASFSGDRILAYFGYPEAHENDAERAVRAGLALIAAVANLAIRPAPSLHLRVGIASGLVVVGDPAHEEASGAPVAIGEAPDLAAQLQSIAAPDTLVIAASTRDLVRGLFDYRELEHLALEGLSDPAPVWRVVGTGAVASRFEALRDGNLTPLVGRDEEIDLLLRRWQQIQSGEGRVVLISGEPGIGKSRLVRALQDRLANYSALSFYCSPSYQHSPLYPVIAELERAAGFKLDDTPEEKLAKFEALVRPSIGEDAIALIAALLSVRSGERYPLPNLSPQRRKERTLEALLARLAAVAGERFVLAVFEDVHWMDPTSRDLLDLIVEQIERLPVLLIVTFRPEANLPWTGQPRVTTLSLRRLGRDESGELVRGLIGDPAALAGKVVDDIVKRSDGVPLFLEELTKAVLETSNVGVAPATSPAVPATLHASLMARLDRLGPTAKEIAQVGAAIGRHFSYELLATAAQLGEPELQRALRRIVDAGLVFQRGVLPQATFLFKHSLVQDTAYSTLARAPRQALHSRIAHALEQKFPSVVQAQPEFVAHHLTEARMSERAVTYWCRAGQLSVARSAFIEAIGQLRRGLLLIADLPDTPARKQQEIDLQVTLAAALRFPKGYAHPEVSEALGRARSLMLETEGAGTIAYFAMLFGLVGVNYIGGEHKVAHEHAREFLSLAQSLARPQLLLMGHQLAGMTLIVIGDYRTALTHLENAVGLYKPEEYQELAYRFGWDPGVRALSIRAWALWHRGHFDEANKAGHEVLRQARQSVHLETLAYGLSYNCLTAVSARRVLEAEQLANELTAFAREHGFALLHGYGLTLQGWVMAQRQPSKAAVEQIRAGLAAARAAGSRFHEPIVLGLLAEALGLVGEIEKGLAVIAEALALARASGASGNDAELHRLRGNFLGRLPCPDQAEMEASYLLALGVAREQGTRGFELRAAVSLARLLGAQGRRDEARDLLLQVCGCFTESFDTPDLKDAKTLLASLR
jgi:DNA-binding response OmpR family regulator/class 3 adenylate cyclase/predicted ATPase